MARYLLSDPAKADVQQILAYLHQRSPDAERRVRARLREEMRRLAEFPHIGHTRADLGDDSCRIWTVYSYLILCRPDPQPIQILRVIHGAKDLPAELGID